MAIVVSTPPEQGQLVTVRHRPFVVTEVTKSTLPENLLRPHANGAQHLVSLSSVDEDSLGEERQYSRLVQITWVDISAFFYERFKAFPETLPLDGRPVHSQWPDFGRFYGSRFRNLTSRDDSSELVWRYINEGRGGDGIQGRVLT